MKKNCYELLRQETSRSEVEKKTNPPLAPKHLYTNGIIEDNTVPNIAASGGFPNFHQELHMSIKNKTSLMLIILLAIILLVGCNFPAKKDKISESDQVLTSAAQTVEAKLTLIAPQGGLPTNPATNTVPVQTMQISSPTIGLTSTQAAPASPTSIPCNWAAFEADATYPDGTEVLVGAAIEKKWRLKNIGSCPWTSTYRIVFQNGTRMNAPDQVEFTTQQVAPGQSIELGVPLTIPDGPGTYRANFMLKSPDGIIFGVGNGADEPFYIEIKALEPTPTQSLTPPPTATHTVSAQPEPDIIITDFTLNPATPVKGQLVQVSITVYNNGDVQAGAFSVKWWAVENDAAPACIWDVTSLSAKGGQVKTCDYSGYPNQHASVNTKVFVDADNTVVESNESNNVMLKQITVNP